MKKSLFLCIGLCLFLTSCASRVRDTLGYAPVIERQEKKHIVLSVNTFEDVRPDRPYIGDQKSILGIPIVEIVTEDDVPSWIRNALKMELKNAGYTILDKHAADGYRVEGKIMKAFTSVYFNHCGYMTIEIALKKGSEIIFQKTYEINKNDGFGLFEFASCTELLKCNLQEVCKSFIADANDYLLKPTPHESAVQ
jgi:hypothetical protein